MILTNTSLNKFYKLKMTTSKISEKEMIQLLENYPYIQQLKSKVKENPSVFLSIFLKRLKETNKDLYILLLQNRKMVATYLSL